jgi:RNA polymerase sigma factor (TIGR02999 family)
MGEDPGQITSLLRRVRNGDAAAEEALLSLVYDDLRNCAAAMMRSEPVGHTLQATALVHEAYLRLMRPGAELDFQDRAHFFALAARKMRQVLIDHARASGAQKRPGKCRRLSLETAIVYTDEVAYALVELDDLLDQLAGWDQRGSRVVEMRVFGDLTMEEIACVLGISSRQVKRDWQAARAWLWKHLNREKNDTAALDAN